jgi:hypothetical protein
VRRRAVGLFALLASAGVAEARDGLKELVPLIELYAENANPKLGFDIAGIRCAGLYAAQADWAATHGLSGPTRKERKDIELHLTRAELYRQNAGQSVSRAYETTRRDVLQVMALYTDRFAERAAKGEHPWTGDPLLRGDLAYCGILGQD